MASFAALCTFCEYHGPSVVLATHSLETDCLASRPAVDSNLIRHIDIETLQNLKHEHQHTNEERRASQVAVDQLTRRLSLHAATVVGGGGVASSGLGLISSNIRSNCNYCSSLDGGSQVLVSHGQAYQVAYVSTQHGLGDIYGMAKDAAIKSISCEVVENRSGRIVFANSPTAATVLAQTFHLPDKNARGFHRYYSIVVGSKMRGHMLRSWPSLSQSCEDIIKLLESKCGPPLTRKDVQEFAKSQNTIANHPPSFNNLEHLTGDKSIFLRLHQKFSSLLARLAISKTEFAVIGAPVQCTLAFNESRILLLVKLVSSLSRRHSGVMLYNMLTGQGLEISCMSDNSSSTDSGCFRQTNRMVADALASLLPNNKRDESVYFANVLLTSSSSSTNTTLATTGILQHSLIVQDSKCSSFTFIDSKCSCKNEVNMCSNCYTPTSSRIVIKFLQLLYESTLNTTILHTKLVTLVEGTLNQAKVWTKLKSQYEEKKFLKQFGHHDSDAKVLSFFTYFVR
eukprot:TRINITY_DN1950_c0_g1_i1.p1 TRINITY_DN1950_c0_g1~~TRINITY_DN1950_c0_g1_i1.p1  ORF type:complete len:511 (-),score=65.52 TRINITY_DN1950_c0_g1_i1:445-1977(-)